MPFGFGAAQSQPSLAPCTQAPTHPGSGFGEKGARSRHPPTYVSPSMAICPTKVGSLVGFVISFPLNSRGFLPFLLCDFQVRRFLILVCSKCLHTKPERMRHGAWKCSPAIAPQHCIEHIRNLRSRRSGGPMDASRSVLRPHAGPVLGATVWLDRKSERPREYHLPLFPTAPCQPLTHRLSFLRMRVGAFYSW